MPAQGEEGDRMAVPKGPGPGNSFPANDAPGAAADGPGAAGGHAGSKEGGGEGNGGERAGCIKEGGEVIGTGLRGDTEIEEHDEEKADKAEHTAEKAEDKNLGPRHSENWYCVNCTLLNLGAGCRRCGVSKSFDPSRPLTCQGQPSHHRGTGAADTGTAADTDTGTDPAEVTDTAAATTAGTHTDTGTDTAAEKWAEGHATDGSLAAGVGGGGPVPYTAGPEQLEVNGASVGGVSTTVGGVGIAEEGLGTALGPAAKTEAGVEGSARGASAGTVSATAVGYDDRMLLHEKQGQPSPHPERPDRLRAILGALREAGLFPGRCIPWTPREVTDLELLQVHTQAHVDKVEASKHADVSSFDPDTYANRASATAARLAAGFSVDITVAVAKKQIKNGIALVRPPGHHAVKEGSQGFCLHNNAAVAARAAQEAGARKVLIVDCDVHHGNGTQDIFEGDPSVLFISLHRYEGGSFYPGTGDPGKVGKGKGKGFSVNIGWPTGGIGDADYISAFKQVVLPIAKQFEPDITIVSAGFDAARGDPLGGCDVSPAGYGQMTSLLMPLAEGRVVVVLEGGYNLRSISASAIEVVKVLLGDAPPPLAGPVTPTAAGLAAMKQTSSALAPYWSGLQLTGPSAHPPGLPHPPSSPSPNSPQGHQGWFQGHLLGPRKGFLDWLKRPWGLGIRSNGEKDT